MVVKLISYSNNAAISPSKQWGRVFDLNHKQLVVMDGFKMFVMSNNYVGLLVFAESRDGTSRLIG
jgi:hypothetical protein